MSGKPKKMGLLTSGGDAPGMNAAIRAVVRTALNYGMKVTGIMRGYDGLLSGDIIDMHARSVSDIIHKGGTILRTARCPEMMTEAGLEKAAGICRVLSLDALVVIGGDGSFHGALELSRRGINVMGIPGTIDLDLSCTDYTIGFDTAINTAMDAINKIRDTSGSHERCSVVEVMGRHAGYIALWSSLTGGAEEVLIPENGAAHNSKERVIGQIIENRALGKKHNLIVVAEGVGGSEALAKEIEKVTGIESRATILGHLQRGGSPTALDRMHAAYMGYKAVESIQNDEVNRVIVFRNGRHESMDITEALNSDRPYDNTMYDIIKMLAR
ncbi:MAG: 6-phosphofructokinase [Clostridiales bacterium]|jgi:6-phosphofructokinase 1|nr:6-phosphofructokinase [Clostridiales bacterium]